mgnify:CR=1
MKKLNILGNSARPSDILKAIQTLQQQHNETVDELRDIKKNLRVNAHFPRRSTTQKEIVKG